MTQKTKKKKTTNQPTNQKIYKISILQSADSPLTVEFPSEIERERETDRQTEAEIESNIIPVICEVI